MTDLVIIGAGKFALEVSRYIDDIAASGPDRYRIERYLAVDGEATHAPEGKCTDLAEYDLREGTRVVLAVSDPDVRRKVIEEYVNPLGLVGENLVHPTSMVEPSSIAGQGNIIGPSNYIGVNSVLSSFNVVNYHCTIGHHSRLGSNNFFSPNFHSGNSIEVGDDNFFGIGCTVAPDIAIGDGCRLQAGLTLFENAVSGHSYLAPSRIKSIRSS